MKNKPLLVPALLLGASLACSAFTLDFAGYEGVQFAQNPRSIFVPGYGELVFEAGLDSELVVNSAYLNDNGFGAPSLSFDQDDAVKITFKGAEPLNVDFDFVGVSAGEVFVVQEDLFTPQAFLVTLQGGDDGAGVYAVSWNAIPEPAAASLGLIGATLLVLRRRREPAVRS
jgi:hypothetical protein